MSITKSELKDIIKECLLEMNCNIVNSGNLTIPEGCSFSDINDEISLFEANINYILSADESYILQESASDTIKSILNKVWNAIKLVIKKIGEFISFIKTKVKGLVTKFTTRSKHLENKAKEIKAKNGEVSEEKLKEKEPEIEEANKVFIGALEDYEKYLKDKDIINNNALDLNKLKLNELYSIKYEEKYDYMDFINQCSIELETIKKALNNIDRLDYIDDKELDLTKYIKNLSNNIIFKKANIEEEISPSYIINQQEDFVKLMDNASRSITGIEKLKKSFEHLSGVISDRIKIREEVIEINKSGASNTYYKHLYGNDDRAEYEKYKRVNEIQSFLRKYIILSNICMSAIKGCNDIMEFHNKRISLAMKGYNLSLKNTEIIMQCIEYV